MFTMTVMFSAICKVCFNFTEHFSACSYGCGRILVASVAAGRTLFACIFRFHHHRRCCCCACCRKGGGEGCGHLCCFCFCCCSSCCCSRSGVEGCGDDFCFVVAAAVAVVAVVLLLLLVVVIMMIMVVGDGAGKVAVGMVRLIRMLCSSSPHIKYCFVYSFVLSVSLSKFLHYQPYFLPSL